MKDGEDMSAAVMITPDGRKLVVFERLVRGSHFGIRFWDQGARRPVVDGLVVTAYALTSSGSLSTAVSPVGASPNPRGVYVFHSIPFSGRDTGSPSPASGSVVIVVRDRLERFLPVAISTPDPLAEDELFITPSAGARGALGEPEPRFFLFSSPARRVSPRTVASIRAQLVQRVSGRPAAHALLEVEHQGTVWYGLADERGSAHVVFPYPKGTPVESDSESKGATGLSDLSWELDVRVRFSNGTPVATLPGVDLPDLRAIPGQPYALIIPQEGGLPVESFSYSLVFGQESVLSSGEEPVLWIE